VSTDNVGIAKYRVYRNRTAVTTVMGTSWSDAALSPSTTYSYAVTAIDQAGNESAAGNTASATTLAATSPADRQAPSRPSGLWASPSTSAARIYLGWSASTDNVGVAGYKIYRNGAHVATVTTTSWTDDGLAYNATYQYGVSAVDAAGNESGQATTSAATRRNAGKQRASGH
jgi:chitin-binding protein